MANGAAVPGRGPPRFGGAAVSDDGLLDAVGVVLLVTLALMVGGLALAFSAGPDGSGTDAAPDADWSLTRANDTHVRLVHEGGAPVAADRLVVTVDGYRRRPAWPDAVTEGTTVAVRADPGLRVRLYWTDDRGERVRLANWRA